jgi:hypothetical protein
MIDTCLKMKLQFEIGKLFGHQLQILAPMIQLEKQGEGLKLQSIKLRANTSDSYNEDCAKEKQRKLSSPINYEPISTYKRTEPRITLMNKVIREAIRLFEFETENGPIKPDGFRLINLKNWARYPSKNLISNMGEFSSYCDANCTFCLQKGCPIKAEKKKLTLKEARTRAKYYVSSKRLGLPVNIQIPGEPFMNRNIFEIIEIYRQAEPDRSISITTHGNWLNRASIRKLAKFKPILLVISLNSSNIHVREQLMKLKSGNIGIEAVPQLKENGIKFIGSLVAWPSIPIDDILETIKFLDKHHCYFIRVCLPGYTKFYSSKKLFETEYHWGKIVKEASALREIIKTPIMMQPNFYWNKDIMAKIDGIIVNSPAMRAGLRFGDEILKVDDRTVITRDDALYALSSSKKQKIPLCFRRNGKEQIVVLDRTVAKDNDFYPWKPKGYDTIDDKWGIFLVQDFKLLYIRLIREELERNPDVKRVILFTTPLVQDRLIQAASIMEKEMKRIQNSAEVRVTIAKHRFWGGNIMIGDLHVVSDYIHHINTIKKLGWIPDLALIPSSFSTSHGFDLLGRSYKEIYRATSVPVKLLPVQCIIH